MARTFTIEQEVMHVTVHGGYGHCCLPSPEARAPLILTLTLTEEQAMTLRCALGIGMGIPPEGHEGRA